MPCFKKFLRFRKSGVSRVAVALNDERVNMQPNQRANAEKLRRVTRPWPDDASILRQIIAGPRLRHPEADLDLCYVTDSIIATSGPSSSYPQRAYRNPTDALVKFLDRKHGDQWSIWEFRAEGTGYTDLEVYNRIQHFPWPDHHPPPFALVPEIMTTMHEWLTGSASESAPRIAVVHCKAGKGRSGTVAISYLVSQQGWTVEDAMDRFTSRRMRVGFGNGVSIPSQVRWIKYVDWWTRHAKHYRDGPAQVKEIKIWGLREGVQVTVNGFVDRGKKIKCIHSFDTSEQNEDDSAEYQGSQFQGRTSMREEPSESQKHATLGPGQSTLADSSIDESSSSSNSLSPSTVVTFRPHQRIILPTSDINIDIVRRARRRYGLSVVTSVAHVWFNTFFEHQMCASSSPERDSVQNSVHTDASEADGTFSIEWEAMDGIKGSARKGARAFDRMSVEWSRSADLNPNDSEPSIIAQSPGVKDGPATISGPVPAQEPRKPMSTNTNTMPEDKSSIEDDNRDSIMTRAKEHVDPRKNADEKVDAHLAEADDDSEKGVKAYGPQGEEHVLTGDKHE